MVELMQRAGFETSVVTAGIVLMLAFGLVVGNRAHFWLWFYVPQVRRHLPTDAGALVGLGVAMALLAA